MSKSQFYTPQDGFVDLETLGKVPVPPETKTYKPVPYVDAVEQILSRLRMLLPDRKIIKQQYALGRDGKHCFVMITLQGDHSKSGLSIGLRQSYDKTFRLALAIGLMLVVCDNLAFSSDAYLGMHRNTKKVWEKFCAMVEEALAEAEVYYDKIRSDFMLLQALPLSLQRGYELIGRAHGEGALMSQQVNIALRSWKDPLHADFRSRDLFSLYQTFNEAVKKGQPQGVLDRHTGIHSFFESMIATWPQAELERAMQRIENGDIIAKA